MLVKVRHTYIKGGKRCHGINGANKNAGRVDKGDKQAGLDKRG